MSNTVDKSSSPSRESALDQWVAQAIGSREIQVKSRLRGNSFHLLFQADPCLDCTTTLLWLIPALQNTDLNTLLPVAQSPIYQIKLYGGVLNALQPEWTASIYLNQLDRHLEQLKARSSVGHSAGSAIADSGGRENSALALSNRSLAQQGQEVAIASYLSEALSNLGIGVQVSAKTVSYKPSSAVQLGSALTAKRLWVACGAAYSPDPSLVAEPIARRLRELEISGYRDAVILFQVAGENHLDWRLRVDLTPPGEMLRDWARWGDVEAIRRLLNQAGQAQMAQAQIAQTQITTAALKESTLHLFCSSSSQTKASEPEIPDPQRSRQWVLDLLEGLAPQGIHAAALYGQAGEAAAAWMEWLELPAARHPALSDSALALAQQRDWEAIAFLLHRLLNPDLDDYLMTGGIRLQLLPKQDLLHIMSEAIVCPDRRWVGETIAKFLRPLKLPGVSGVRIYGRRAGQKLPLWSYGLDFVERHHLVPEAAPEFVATDSFVQELISPSDEPILRPDLTPADIQSAWQQAQHRLLNGVEKVLTRSQLFTSSPTSQALAMASSPLARSGSAKTAIVWGTVGLLLTLQVNWLLGGLVQTRPADKAHSAPAAPIAPAPVVSSTLPEEPDLMPSSSLKAPVADGVFNSEGFTQKKSGQTSPSVSGSPVFAGSSSLPGSSGSSALPYTVLDPAATQITAEILATEPALPTFNSQQLDDKLKLYYQYLEDQGEPPDVLIIGSSRALRGVDPAALQQELAKLGPDLTFFNFGVNGATAQVANFLVQQLLTPEQLPRLIVWADGARAFNSGAVDVTYNGIAASVGYRQLRSGQFPVPASSQRATAVQSQVSGGEIPASLTSSYESLDRWFSHQLAQLSGTYSQRDRLKRLFQEKFSSVIPVTASPPPVANPSGSPLVDPQGFLSLAVQFNPATYYQKYARVTGEYDSDYENFQLAGLQETAARSLLQFTQQQDIPVVFVNLPLTEDYLDPTRYRHEQEFKAYMVSLDMGLPQFIFRDLGDRWTAQYVYFSDPSHLNRYGAYAVSQQLAQDPLIPWTEANSQKSGSGKPSSNSGK